ncbi:sugar O-acetyltransferase [Actinomyces weissii]
MSSTRPSQAPSPPPPSAPGPFPDAARYLSQDGRSNRQRMRDGDWYVSDDAENETVSARARRALARYEQAFIDGDPQAGEHLRQAVPAAHPTATVRPPLWVDYGENLSIGAGTFINYGLTALDVAPISIGDRCQIGPHCQLLTPIHPLEPSPRAAGVESADPIVLEDNVWLGGGVIVCPGVRIGRNSVIGAGSVVTRDVPPDVVAVGNPARVLRALDDSTFRPRH